MVWSGFILGLLGSLHCIGMCGPIAMALPIPQKSGLQKMLAALLYNVGRVLAYVFLGLVLSSISQLFNLHKWQGILSITIGVVLMISLVFPYAFKFTKTPKIFQYLKNAIGTRMRNASMTGLFVIGFLNGLLPCGLVYTALIGAFALTIWWHPSAFLALFGMGTIPAMFSIAYYKHLITFPIRRKIQKAIPVLLFVWASLFILRGLNLGIPYISPHVNEVSAVSGCCHNAK
ncbi:MAG: sulfite exporter TauE/SafE family protein [Chitinophagales bacterium]|nr:sulfite exporter TauE/SafE family protein [Chitinophagales bacterium]